MNARKSRLVVAGLVIAVMGIGGIVNAQGRRGGRGRFAGRGPGFVDQDGNGVCDRLEKGLPPVGGQGRGMRGGRGRFAGRGAFFGRGARWGRGRGQYFGRSGGLRGGRGQFYGRGRFAGRGPGFVDQNGNGVCDRFEKGLPPVGGQGRGYPVPR